MPCRARAVRIVAPAILVISASLVSGPVAKPAFALTRQEAWATCIETHGKPFVVPCMQRGMSLQACQKQNAPNFMACMRRQFEAARRANEAPTRANVALPVPADPARKSASAGATAKASFVAPPRTIADITAIIDREKSDPKMIQALRTRADADPTGKESRAALAQFYLDRGNARSQLGRLKDAMSDGEQAVKAGRGVVHIDLFGRILHFLGQQQASAGEVRKALATVELFRSAITDDVRTYHLLVNRSLANYYVRIGDIARAEAEVRKNAQIIAYVRTTGIEGWRRAYNNFGQMFETEIDHGAAILREARGQFKEAEDLYRQAELRKRAAIDPMIKFARFPPDRSALLLHVDDLVLSQARMRAKQGRLADAEVDARRALLARLQNGGKYNVTTPRFIMGLADILVEQGRYAEAEKLVRVCLEINRTVGASEDSLSTVQYLAYLGSVLVLQRKNDEATAVYAELDKASAGWDAQQKRSLDTDGNRIMSLYASGQIDSGIRAAEDLLKRHAATFGEMHFETAAARGTLAIGYAKAGRDADARREFTATIPVLMSASRENADDDNTTMVAARSQRLQRTVETYFALLTRQKDPGGDIAAETFALADAIRGRSVQQALAASSARAAAKDPALAELVRTEQDLAKQVNAQLGMLNNVLSLPSGERDDKGVQAIMATVAKLRQDRLKPQQEIARRFPAYAELVAPRPPTLDQIRAALREDEAMLSFYFGAEGSFVWAVPNRGPAAFAAIAATSAEIESKLRKLREALEPQVTMISEIPAFDTTLGYELYSLLLKPVEAGWKQSKNLIVVTNGALGLMPLSLLPTEKVALKGDGDVLFSGYRDVPWLARTHAVTMVPSAATLRTLRGLPPGKPDRGPLIAFGDPLFSKSAAAEAERRVQVADASDTTRGLPLRRRNAPKLEGVDSAELALLPQLPDTSDELKSIALALQADQSKVLNLGKDANEHKVKTINLSTFKIVAFATHGLVPGELNGLNQPALALTAPDVADVEGDGLLTMEEVLALKLDADWVVLSACNTGSGAEAGAEAASGLGRAFFYAGTRALLVTNWSVHSQSARELVTDLFKRQADDAKLPRGEALRQAMMALADGKGYVNASGKTDFTYAHPLFWAPYTIIGDGGSR